MTAYRLVNAAGWAAAGRRQMRLFGVDVSLTPDSEMPLRTLSYPLPRHRSKDKVVRYGDFVQMHALANYIEELDRPKPIVDVGAFHGIYVILAAVLLKRRFGAGQVLAIEPNPRAFSVLERNVRLNRLEDVVVCVNACCAETECTMHITEQGSESQMLPSETGAQVVALPLDTILERQAILDPGLIMIDTEGAELKVLQGLTFEKHRPDVLLCELHPSAWAAFGCTAEKFEAFLAEKRLVCIDAYLHHHQRFAQHGYTGPCLLASPGGPSSQNG